MVVLRHLKEQLIGVSTRLAAELLAMMIAEHGVDPGPMPLEEDRTPWFSASVAVTGRLVMWRHPRL